MRTVVVIALSILAGCAQIPDGLRAVEGFDADRYLGTWYEIARLDHRFERGLTNVTATYARRPDGSIDVLNRGFDPEQGRWDEARGRARFAGAPDVAMLEVSFFGPFYGGYNVLELDPDYTMALVSGPTLSYLWILARRPDPSRETVDRLVQRARELGFDTSGLIFVEHDRR